MTEVKSKNAEKFVSFLEENKITAEKQPVYLAENGYFFVSLHDKIESTGYTYQWEVVFDPNNCLANINALRIVEGINEANLVKTYELLNEKNKNTLWGKYFVDNGAVSTTAVFYSRDGEILPEDLLDILKLMRFSIEELHKDLLKELL